MKRLAFISRHVPSAEQAAVAAQAGVELVHVGDRDAFSVSLTEFENFDGVVVVHPAAAVASEQNAPQKPKEKRMNAKTLEAITRQGNALLAAFPNASEQNPVTLCKKLRRIEIAVGKPILDFTNGVNRVTEEDLDHACIKARSRVKLLLGINDSVKCGLFVNRDPRGYALKLDNESAVIPPGLHKDWGGYGILAPDFS